MAKPTKIGKTSRKTGTTTRGKASKAKAAAPSKGKAPAGKGKASAGKGKASAGKAARGARSGGATRAARPAASATKTAAARATAPTAAVEETSRYSLEKATAMLGEPPAALERAYRAGHSDEELRKEGARVATWRIVDDGERLCSKALAHLESKDADVQAAARRAGLSRGLVALAVDVFLRQKGEDDARKQHSRATEASQGAAAVSLEAATASARKQRRGDLKRLSRLVSLDPKLAELHAQCTQAASTAPDLAQQVEALADLMEQVVTHPGEHVRAMASARHLGEADVEELRRSAAAVRTALEQRQLRSSEQQEQEQAVLDVLDGLGLLLVEDIFVALRSMAERTPKVRRPSLHSLRTHFGARSRTKDDDEGETDTPPEA